MINRVTYVVATIGLLCGTAGADDGVTSNKITLGQSCALSGPAEALGTGMQVGLEAYFASKNDQGGIHGRSVTLISKDDGYEPDRAISNTRELIEDEKVFLLIGEVGTPTSQAVVPIIEEGKVPFVAPFTGAEFLRNPFKRYVVNVRASYYQEMEKLAEYLVDQKKFTKISCFYQNDGYGQAGLSGIKIALEKRGLELHSTENYERNTLAVKGGVLRMRKAAPEAIVMVGAYKPCAEFIKLCKKAGLKDSIFCNISFVGTDALSRELGDLGQGCIISQVVRFPWDESVPLVAEYTAAMKKYKPEEKIGFVSLEGYMAGKFFSMVAEKVGADLTREAFIDAVSAMKTVDLGGVVLEFGKSDHQGMDEVFLTIIQGGNVQTLERN